MHRSGVGVLSAGTDTVNWLTSLCVLASPPTRHARRTAPSDGVVADPGTMQLHGFVSLFGRGLTVCHQQQDKVQRRSA